MYIIYTLLLVVVAVVELFISLVYRTYYWG